MFLALRLIRLNEGDCVGARFFSFGWCVYLDCVVVWDFRLKIEEFSSVLPFFAFCRLCLGWMDGESLLGVLLAALSVSYRRVIFDSRVGDVLQAFLGFLLI